MFSSDHQTALRFQLEDANEELLLLDREHCAKQNELSEIEQTISTLQTRSVELRKTLRELAAKKSRVQEMRKDLLALCENSVQHEELDICSRDVGNGNTASLKGRVGQAVQNKASCLAQKDNEGLKSGVSVRASIVSRNKSTETNISDCNEMIETVESFETIWNRLSEAKEIFGIKEYREAQIKAMGSTMRGKDCFVIMASGSGKSLCYQAPAFAQKGLTVVISPLLSLMNDQIFQLEAVGIEAKMMSATTTKEEQRDIFEDIQTQNGVLRLLYVTPEKFVRSRALINAIKGAHKKQRLRRFVIDEVHCCSQWGFDFRPDYNKLSKIRDEFPQTPIMALTATATEKVRKDVVKILKVEGCEMVVGSFDRPNIFYRVELKGAREEETLQQIKLVVQKYATAPGIIYCTTRNQCEKLKQNLRKVGVVASTYHSGHEEEEKNECYEQWIEEKRFLIIATTAFGMGINKPNVRYVIHYTVSQSIEAFSQESGRAGRDGLPAESILLYSPKDIVTAAKVSNKLGGITNLVRFCHSKRCRRAFFAEYFGLIDCDSASTSVAYLKNGNCGHCDNCSRSDGPIAKETDVTKHAKTLLKILTTIRSSPGKQKNVTVKRLLDLWRGKGKKQLKGVDVEFLGRKELSDLGAESVVMALVAQDVLSLSVAQSSYSANVYVSPGRKSFSLNNVVTCDFAIFD